MVFFFFDILGLFDLLQNNLLYTCLAEVFIGLCPALKALDSYFDLRAAFIARKQVLPIRIEVGTESVAEREPTGPDVVILGKELHFPRSWHHFLDDFV